MRCERERREAGCGSAALRLAVPCGTRCWLPPWHLPFVLWLFMCCCCCCCIQLCGDTAPLCPVSSIPPIGSVIKRFIREYCGRALDGREDRRGAAEGGHFCSPSLRETELQGHGEAGAHPGRFGCLFLYLFFIFYFLQLLTCFNFITGDAKNFPRQTDLCPPPRILEL